MCTLKSFGVDWWVLQTAVSVHGTAGTAAYLHLFVCLDGLDGSLRG
jgi:hypothetical protein